VPLQCWEHCSVRQPFCDWLAAQTAGCVEVSLGLGVSLSQHHIIWNAIQSPTYGLLCFRTLPKALELVYLGFFITREDCQSVLVILWLSILPNVFGLLLEFADV